MTTSGFTLSSPEIEACLQCLVPATIGSCAPDGTPNVTWVSIVYRLDESHIGLSRQFFRKTSSNMEVNRYLQVLFLHPHTGRQFRLNVQYESTDTDGPRFDYVRTMLDAIASEGGMTKVFRLIGLDVCEVLSIEAVPSDSGAPDALAAASAPLRQAGLAQRIGVFSESLNNATDIEDLMGRALAGLQTCFGYNRSFIMLVDESGERLFTVASRGYESSGAGSEVRMGEGQIGVSAQNRRPVLLSNVVKERLYTDAVRESVTRAGQADSLESEIALPGGAGQVMSQLTVPLMARGQLLGALVLQSDVAGRFVSEDEHIAVVAATELGLSMALLRLAPVIDVTPPSLTAAPRENRPNADIRHYAADDSIFVDDQYLIKGIAGRILWRLLRDYSEKQRVEFSNKEIRLDSSLELPDIKDNLETRLILLRRRLEDQCNFLRIVKTSRGRFRLSVDRPLSLQDVPV